ncbi:MULTISPECIES: hypothetical protein [unclassified Mycobacterium]|uniref:hypothetical protein n=1 Tax=unclassified Mycobacterium TaxID=2642494 RepID=UPI0029C85DFA|nr:MULTISPECIES: hypothetical protein [unclassified Mycobacterium]
MIATDDEFALFGPDGEPTALARHTDPHTSREAAAGIVGDRLRTSQTAVLAVLRHHGPLDDRTLVDVYDMLVATGAQPRQSPSGIRSRRHELVEAGQVVDTGDRVKLPSGRRAIVWAAA